MLQNSFFNMYNWLTTPKWLTNSAITVSTKSNMKRRGYRDFPDLLVLVLIGEGTGQWTSGSQPVRWGQANPLRQFKHPEIAGA